jgi:FAD/FMN-containing dehydrogenase
VLDRLHEAAAAAGMLFPLSLSSQGSCRIGGNIATNAGGVQVLSYGNTRSLVLGLEVVLASGEIWNGLRALPKDNSGYDLKQLFIGSEGTLGIITAAVLRLFPAPRGQAVAFAAVPSPHEALVLLKQARAEAGAGLTAFELIPRIAIEMVVAKLPGAQDPFAAPSPWYVLMEVSSGRDEADAGDLIVRALTPGLEAGTVTDAVVANSVKEAQAFWRIRHALSEVQKHFGASIKHDVSVPVQRVPDFLDRAIAAVKEMVPGIRPVPFGHLGDGNIHFNLTQPEGADGKAYFARAPEVHRLVHGIVTEMGGSIAAEHGVGLYKRELLKDVKSPVELAMMRKLKATFDPNGILNPGKVV